MHCETNETGERWKLNNAPRLMRVAPAAEAAQLVQLLVRASSCSTAEHFVVKSAAYPSLQT